MQQVEVQVKHAVEQHLDGINFDMEVPIPVSDWLLLSSLEPSHLPTLAKDKLGLAHAGQQLI